MCFLRTHTCVVVAQCKHTANAALLCKLPAQETILFVQEHCFLQNIVSMPSVQACN